MCGLEGRDDKPATVELAGGQIELKPPLYQVKIDVSLKNSNDSTFPTYNRAKSDNEYENRAEFMCKTPDSVRQNRRKDSGKHHHSGKWSNVAVISKYDLA